MRKRARQVKRDTGEQLNPTERFLDLLRNDLLAATIATIALGAIASVYRAWDLLWLCAAGFTSALIRFAGGRYAQRGDLRRAVTQYAVGFWASTIISVALVPIGLPVFLFNVLIPVLIAATYLEDRDHRSIAFGAIAVVSIVAVLGLVQDGVRIEQHGPEWAVDAAIIGFLIGHTWMFTAAIRDGNRTRVATLHAVVERADELRESQQELRESRRRIVEVADAERGRIERDIHDGAQQRLVSLAVRLKLAAQLTDEQPITAEQLDAMHEEATDALQELRDLASGIYPSLLAERGLADALQAACRRSSVPVAFRNDLEQPAPVHLAADLYFVANEALQNASKHAGDGAEVVVRLSNSGEMLVLEVEDDGVGFDPSEFQTRGLLNMRDRLASLNGSLDIVSASGEGTRLVAAVPVDIGIPAVELSRVDLTQDQRPPARVQTAS